MAFGKAGLKFVVIQSWKFLISRIRHGSRMLHGT